MKTREEIFKRQMIEAVRAMVEIAHAKAYGPCGVQRDRDAFARNYLTIQVELHIGSFDYSYLDGYVWKG